MEALLEGISFITAFLADSYTWVEQIFIEITSWVVIWSLELKLYAAHLAWGIAEAILANTNLSNQINQAWGSVDSQLLGYLTFFRLPEAINIMLQAHVTKFTLRLMGL